MDTKRNGSSKRQKKASEKRKVLKVLSDLNMLESHSSEPCTKISNSSDSSDCEDEPIVKRKRKTTSRVIDPAQILSSDYSEANVYTTVAKKSFEEINLSKYDFSKYCEKIAAGANEKEVRISEQVTEDDLICLDNDCGFPGSQEVLPPRSQSPAPPTPPSPVRTKPMRTRSFSKITKNLNKIQSSIQKLDKVLHSDSPDDQCLDDSCIIIEEDDVQEISDSPSDDFNRDIVVMVKIGSEIKRFPMNTTDMFCNLFSFLAKEKQVPDNRLMLLLNERTIQQNETPLSIKLQVADIIDCLITQEEEEQEEENLSERTGPNVISLVIQSSTNQKLKKTMRIGKFESLQGIINLWAKQHNVPAINLKLRFDGEIVNAAHTPADLDIEDEDCLDLIMV